MLKKLFTRRPSSTVPRPTIPAGERVYAIGDIHGRLDLLDALLASIEADDAARGPAATRIVFLGDVVDRGPDSAAVIDRLMTVAQARPTTAFLKGNHEEVFLLALDGDREALRLFCRIGGRETILSYGIDPDRYERLDYDALAQWIADAVPAAHREFLGAFEDMVVVGDYAFVHAGVRPDVALAEQRGADLRWIRNTFLNHTGGFAKTIVHGHTISDDMDRGHGRIGIDTGAYATGRLTALGLEGDRDWCLQT